jgi:hypothetical protein
MASRGLKFAGLKLSSTHRPSSRADSAIAAGRSLNFGAAPDLASSPSNDSRIDRY